MKMWNNALAVCTCIWTFASVFGIYSIGTLILQGAWRQFLFSIVFWLVVTAAEITLAILDQ